MNSSSYHQDTTFNSSDQGLPIRPHPCEVVYGSESSEAEYISGSNDSGSFISPPPELPVKASDIPKRQKSRSPTISNGDSDSTRNQDNLSTSLSTLSTISEDASKQVEHSASPEAHLKKLKRIHRLVKRRKRLRRCRRIFHFLCTQILPPILLFVSALCIICGYFLHLEMLLIVGCLTMLVVAGSLLQHCFSKRTSANKFNPAEVAFSLPTGETVKPDEPEIVQETNLTVPTPRVSKAESIPDQENQEQAEDQLSPLPTGFSNKSSVVIGMNPIQARRLSIALARASSGQSIGATRPRGDADSGMLGFARRISMAGSAVGFVGPMHAGRGLDGDSWTTGGRIPHGVRRGLAWNATGASRFYAQNYD